MASRTYEVAGMTCQSCVQTVQAKLEQVSGVESANVSLNPPQVTLEGGLDSVTLDDLAAALPEKYKINEQGNGTADHLVKLGDSSSKANSSAEENEESKSKTETYWPLILVVGYILAGTLIYMQAVGSWTLATGMAAFMGLFFVAFSFFKMLDLRGFADAYRSYDWVAGAAPVWGFVYPFVELLLGVAYLLRFFPLATAWATLIVMTVSICGVIQAVVLKNRIQCACLGTGFNLPMSTVTIIEDGAMILMAAIMILQM